LANICTPRSIGRSDIAHDGEAGIKLATMARHGHAGTFHMSRSFRRHSLPILVGSMEVLRRINRTDGDVVSVTIPERKLRSASVGIHMWLFFQKADERARPLQSYVKVVDPEE
jgi:hypothetical protein